MQRKLVPVSLSMAFQKDDGWRYRRRPTLEHRTEPPKVQMRSRRTKKMKNKIRTARDAITH